MRTTSSTFYLSFYAHGIMNNGNVSENNSSKSAGWTICYDLSLIQLSPPPPPPPPIWLMSCCAKLNASLNSGGWGYRRAGEMHCPIIMWRGVRTARESTQRIWPRHLEVETKRTGWNASNSPARKRSRHKQRCWRLRNSFPYTFTIEAMPTGCTLGR